MNVQYFSSIKKIPDYKKFLDLLPVFATQEYADLLKETGKYSTLWFQGTSGKDIRFIIPLAVKNKYIFKIGMFLTAVISLVEENPDHEIERDFLNSIISVIKLKRLCDWIQQSPNWAIFTSYPDGAVFTEFGTYRFNLQAKTNNELFNSIQTKTRKAIKRTIKEGVEIKRGFDYLKDALALITATGERAHIPLPSETELHSFQNNVDVFVSYYQNVPQSSAIFYSNKFAWYSMYAGSREKPFRSSNALLYWTAIKSAREEGVMFFDFVGARINPQEGSKQESIQRFKSHFGVELAAGFMWKMTVSKNKYYIYMLLAKVLYTLSLRKLKEDIIDQELKRSRR